MRSSRSHCEQLPREREQDRTGADEVLRQPGATSTGPVPSFRSCPGHSSSTCGNRSRGRWGHEAICARIVRGAFLGCSTFSAKRCERSATAGATNGPEARCVVLLLSGLHHPTWSETRLERRLLRSESIMGGHYRPPIEQTHRTNLSLSSGPSFDPPALSD